MASTDKPNTEHGKQVSSVPPSSFKADVVLRVLLFASALSAVLVLVTSKQTARVPLPMTAKFQHSPAFIYFLVALCVAGFYSLITIFVSISAIMRPQHSTKFLFPLIICDVLMLGIVASATGTAGGVAYIGLKGNNHVRWNKICSVFDKFCRHIGSSIAVSLFASVLLVLLLCLNANSLRKRINA